MPQDIQRSFNSAISLNEGKIRGYGLRMYDATEPGTEYIYRAKRSERSADIVQVHERIVDRSHLEPLAQGDVAVLFNHDKNQILGRTSAGTAVLRVDERGIHFEATPLPGDRVLQLVERGDVKGASFWGHEASREIDREDGVIVSRLKLSNLYEIGPVTFPAYKGTHVSRDLSDMPTVSQWIDRMTAQQRRQRTLVYFGLGLK